MTIASKAKDLVIGAIKNADFRYLVEDIVGEVDISE